MRGTPLRIADGLALRVCIGVLVLDYSARSFANERTLKDEYKSRHSLCLLVSSRRDCRFDEASGSRAVQGRVESRHPRCAAI